MNRKFVKKKKKLTGLKKWIYAQVIKTFRFI